jgi:flagellar basal body rod protein FlgG
VRKEGTDVLRGIYTAASGLLASTQWQKTVAHDLANVNTPGFKTGEAVIGSFGTILLSRTGTGAAPVGAVSQGTALVANVTNLSEGPLEVTGRHLDVAPYGGAWLTVRTKAGVRYTQDGALTENALGQMTTSAGDPVLSRVGTPIVIPPGQTPRIAPDGTVTAGGRVVGQMALVTFARPQALVAEGQGLMQAPPPAGVRPIAAGQAQGVMQGALEGANTSESDLVVQMTELQAAYTADQESLVTGDRAFQALLSNLGR